MNKQDTQAVLNMTGHLVTLKAQVRNKKDDKNPIKFKFVLEPGVMNFVPKVMWAQFKRNQVTKAMLDTGELMVGAEAKKEVAKREPEKPKAKTQSSEEALVNQLENNGDVTDDENENDE